MIQEKFFLSRIPKLVWVLITIVILAGISFSIYSFIKNKNAESEKVEQRTDTVKRGDVALTLTGSGAVTPRITSYNVCYTKLLRLLRLMERHVQI